MISRWELSLFAMLITVTGGLAGYLIHESWSDLSAAQRLCTRTYTFEPTPDITAYQLSKILSRLSNTVSLKKICVSESKPIPDHLLPQFRELP